MKACCYVRTSTLDQAREEKVSIPDQIKWAKTFALERGWEWIGEYIEPGVTGDTEPDQREALSRLLDDAKKGIFDILLVYHSSRLAREPDIGMRVCRILGQIKIQTYFRNAPTEPVLRDKFAWGTNVGNQYMMAFSFIGDFQENVARSERVRSGFQGLARRGILAFAPFGYKKIPKIITDEYGKQRYTWNFEIEPSEELIVRKIYEKYNNGGSIRQTMLWLNKDKIPSPSGQISNEAWSAATVKNILNNPAYIGKVRWGRRLGGKYLQGKSTSGKQKRINTDPQTWILVDGNQPKIISEDLFNKVQERLKARYVLRGRAIASDGLLVGLVTCGRCGKHAYYKTRRLKRKNNLIRSDYTCQTHIRFKTCNRHLISGKKIHTIVINEISKIASNKIFRKKLLIQGKENNNKSLQNQLISLKHEYGKINEKQIRILHAYENQILTLEQYGAEKRRLDDESLRLNEEITKISKNLLDKSSSELAKKKFIKVLKDFKRQFLKAEFIKQKELLHALIESVIVSKNKIDINYRI